MVCIYCNSKTKVSNSRSNVTTWRRRECTACKSVFTTYERPDYKAALRVENTAKHLEPFLRDKLFLSLVDALAHKKTALGDASSLCDTIITQLAHEHRNGLLTTQQIAACSVTTLKRFDTVAASVYAAKHNL